MGWKIVVQDGSQWPAVHIFVPALISIYTQDIWKLISAIYIFESVEFLVSQIPGLDYWGEADPADAIVSDIIMGLLGFLFVKVLEFKVPQKVSRFAFLSPQNIKAARYASFAPYLHVLLGAISSMIGAAGAAFDFLPKNSPWEYISFTLLYSLVSLAFGFNQLAVYMFSNMVIITIICVYFGYTVVVAGGTVFLSTSAIYYYRKWQKRNYEPLSRTRGPILNQNSGELDF